MPKWRDRGDATLPWLYREVCEPGGRCEWQKRTERLDHRPQRLDLRCFGKLALLRPRPCIFLLVLVLLLAGCKRNSGEKLAATELSDGQIQLTVSPGKPGSPSESILAGKLDGAFFLLVKRVDNSGKVLEEERAELPEPAFVQLWDLVERNGLRAIAIKPGKEQISDFGEMRLRLEWKKAANDATPDNHEVIWTQPLSTQQQEKLDSVFAQLGTLAKDHAKKVQLHYFPAN